MSVITVTKKGGPYSKKDQMIRRDKVFHLHFELGHSATQISMMLNVNRNTINSDIKYLYSQLSKNWESRGINSRGLIQIQRLEFQRARLFGELEKQERYKEKHMIEKLLFDIDNRLLQFIVKIKEKSHLNLANGHNEKDYIKDIVEYLIQTASSKGVSAMYTYDEIVFNLVKKNSCRQNDASVIFDQMVEFGMEYFENKKNEDDDPKYDLKEFAKFRGYIKD